MKIYVHNFFNELLFITLAHNSTNRVYNIDTAKKIGTVLCEYNGNLFEFIFNPKLNDNTDGIHIIDYFSIHRNCYTYENFNHIKEISYDKMHDTKIIKRIVDLISDKKDWVFIYLRNEKVLAKSDIPNLETVVEVEELLQKLKNHIIISDNVFLNDEIHSERYPNFFHAFTNTIHNWNDLIGIRWFYEFKDLFKNLNKPYDIGFSVRRLKQNRIEILKLLKKQNNKKIFLSFTDVTVNQTKEQQIKIFNEHFSEFLDIGLDYNTKSGENDFENTTHINDLKPIGLDLFFRILPKSKMQILDESWAHSPVTYVHQYISEKTIGYILAEIPFISTQIYPLDILEKVLGLDRHPFYNEIKECYGDSKKFCIFVRNFLEDFDKNYLICLEWSKKANETFMNMLLSKNDLLDLIQTNFKKNNTYKSTKLI